MDEELTAREFGEIIWIAVGCLALLLVIIGYIFIIDIRRRILKVLKRVEGLINFEQYVRKE